MYELTGKIKDMTLDFRSGKAFLTLAVNEKAAATACFDELNRAEKLAIKLDVYRERRSLDANAYCFALIGKIAAKINASKEDVYRAAVKEIGGNYDVVCVKNEAVDSLCCGWSRNGLGWQTDTLPSKIDGCTNVILYYGSSTYDTAQMSRLIDIIIQECKQLGIETKTQAEIDSLLDLWSK